jgi:dTDP-3-amino-3,4,6-trideoxy-alpha-D-glucose transaminase
MNIPFNDLKSVHDLLAGEIQEAVLRVTHSGWYILGPEVETFEAEFAAYHGAAHAIGVASGTDAIELALRAAAIGPGDEVITVSHTAVPTVCAIELTGAQPILVDIDPVTYTIDPDAVRAAITSRTRAIVPVHLYGHPVEMDTLSALAEQHNLLVVEDCAQAHGARYQGRLVGTWGHMGAFSFYPTKNLGAYGDGGAIITNDAQLADRLRRLRNYGQIRRYVNAERGLNSRLDEMQAAILRVKLAHLDAHNTQRRRLAAHYDHHLHGLEKPITVAGAEHAFHLYVVRHPQRDQLIESLAAQGIGTLIHYPIAVHQQEAYLDLGYAAGSLPVTERIVKQIVSLPLYVSLNTEQIGIVCDAINHNLELIDRDL